MIVSTDLYHDNMYVSLQFNNIYNANSVMTMMGGPTKKATYQQEIVSAHQP